MNQSIKTQIHEYIAAHKNDILADLMTLVKIPSVRQTGTSDKPYGKACDDVLHAFAALCERERIPYTIPASRDYLLATLEKGEKSLGLFSHLDVVNAENDWVYTNPFEPLEQNGFLFGRGVSDDKSGAVISLYILKMIRELQLPVHSSVKLVAGINEESGMADMDSFVANEKIPDFSLVIDTAFPLYRGNKSNVMFTAVGKTVCRDILDFSGGTAESGCVLGEASAIVTDSDMLFAELSEKKTARITLSREFFHEKPVIRIAARGIPTHAALPQGSLNAGFLIADLLSQCESLYEKDRREMQTLSDMLGRYYGEWFGISHEDEFGKTTCINKRIVWDRQKPILYFNIRHGSTQTKEEIVSRLQSVLDSHGFDLCDVTSKEGYYIAKENPFVQGLLSVYADYTHSKSGTGVLNAGGTYARKLSGKAVETGTWMRKRPTPPMKAGHGNVHQPDEFIDVDGFFDALELNLFMLLKADEIL